MSTILRHRSEDIIMTSMIGVSIKIEVTAFPKRPSLPVPQYCRTKALEDFLAFDQYGKKKGKKVCKLNILRFDINFA